MPFHTAAAGGDGMYSYDIHGSLIWTFLRGQNNSIATAFLLQCLCRDVEKQVVMKEQ